MNDLAPIEAPFWTAELASAIALQEEPTKEVCTRFNVSLEQWREIVKDAGFLGAVKAAREALQKEEAGFRLKARAKAGRALKTLGDVMEDPSAPARDRIEAAKTIIKDAADLGSKSNTGAGSGPGLSIQINLG